VHDELRGQAHRLDGLPQSGVDGVLYHLAIDSAAGNLFLQLPLRRGVVYHNLTPARFLRGVSSLNFERVRDARRALPRLAAAAELGIALSEYSRAELVGAGFARTAVCPMAVATPPAEVPRAPAPATVLGVGRIAPNKRWELAIRAMAALRRELPDARMEIAGNDEEMGPYARALNGLSARLNAGTVLRGKVSAAELEAAYARATVLLLPSAHEGLGLPLLEAMARGVPVVATARAAIPETVERAGLLCGDDPLEIAAALARVITDPRLAGVLTARGRWRAALYDDSLVRARLAAAFASWGPDR